MHETKIKSTAFVMNETIQWGKYGLPLNTV